jgi:hypothetical protein
VWNWNWKRNKTFKEPEPGFHPTLVISLRFSRSIMHAISLLFSRRVIHKNIKGV